jgi:archaellum component FlaC
MLKTEREQNIENNQEIHEINKRLECICERMKAIKENINKIQA